MNLDPSTGYWVLHAYRSFSFDDTSSDRGGIRDRETGDPTPWSAWWDYPTDGTDVAADTTIARTHADSTGAYQAGPLVRVNWRYVVSGNRDRDAYCDAGDWAG